MKKSTSQEAITVLPPELCGQFKKADKFCIGKFLRACLFSKAFPIVGL